MYLSYYFKILYFLSLNKSINILDVNEIISLSSHGSNHIHLSSVDKFSKLVYNLFIILKYFALQLSHGEQIIRK